MAWSLDHAEGFDHDIESTAGGGLFGSLVNATIVAGAARTGGFGLRCSPGAAAAGNADINRVVSITWTQLCVKVHVKLPSPLPASDLQLLSCYSGAGHRDRIFLQSNGKLRMENWLATVSDLSTATYTAGQTVSIEFRAFIASSGNRTLRWRLDGTDEGSIGPDGNTSTTQWALVRLGSDSTTGPAATLDYDDLVIFGSTQTTEESAWPTQSNYQLEVRMHKPKADSTHVMGSGTFRDSTGTSITAGTTNAWTFVDDVPTPGTDYIEKLTGTGGIVAERLAIALQDMADVGATGTPAGAKGFVGMAESASQAEIASVYLKDTVTPSEHQILEGDIGSTTLTYIRSQFAALSLVTTQAKVDGLELWFGGSDATPNPRLHVVWANVIYLPAAGGTMTPVAVAATATITGALVPLVKRYRAPAVTATLTPDLVRISKRFRSQDVVATLAGALVRLRFSPRALPVTATLTPALVSGKIQFKTQPVTATFTGVLTGIKIAPRLQAVTATLTAALTRLGFFPRAQPVTVTLTPTADRLAKRYRALDGVVTLTPNLVRLGLRFALLAVTTTLSAALATAKSSGRTISTGVTLTPVLARIASRQRTLASGITFTVNTVKVPGINRALTVTITPVATPQKFFFRTFTGSITLTPTSAGLKMRVMTFPLTATLTGVLARISLRKRPIDVTATLTPTADRKVTGFRTFAGALSLSPALLRVSTRPRSFAASVTLTGALTALKSRFMGLPVTVTFTNVISTRLLRLWTFAANLVLTPAVQRKITKTFAYPLVITPTLVGGRTQFRTLPVGVTLSPVLQQQLARSRTLSATMTIATTLNRLSYKSRLLAVGAPISVALERLVLYRLNMNVSAIFDSQLQKVRPISRSFDVPVQINAALSYASMIAERSFTFAANINFTATMRTFRVKYGDLPLMIGLAVPQIISAVVEKTEIVATTLKRGVIRFIGLDNPED